MSRKNFTKNLARVKPGALDAGIALGLEENVAPRFHPHEFVKKWQ